MAQHRSPGLHPDLAGDPFLHVARTHPPHSALRVAIATRGRDVPAWFATALKDAIADGAAVLAAAVVCGHAPAVASASRLSPFRMLCKLDDARYRREDDTDRRVDLSAGVGPVDVIEAVMSARDDGTFAFDATTLRALADREPDVLLRVDAELLSAQIFDVVHAGIWSIEIGGVDIGNRMLAGFWEVARQDPTTQTSLVALRRSNGGAPERVVLRSAHSVTDAVSPTRNRVACYPHASALLRAALRRSPPTGELVRDTVEMSGQPGPVQSILIAGRLAARLVARKLRYPSPDSGWKWRLAFHHTPIGDSDVPHTDPRAFLDLVPQRDRFWADPFPVKHEGRVFVFFEERLFARANAYLVVAELGAEGWKDQPRVVLEEAFHLSYPFVFQWNETWYMIPETFDAGRVCIYRATRFPDRWERLDDLLPYGVVDVTLAEIDGVWWMFAGGIVAGAEDASALLLYSATSPLGPWLPHPKNPVRLDVRGTRPAGRLYRRGPAWIRPGQDGAPTYGTAVILHRIVTLTSEEYVEEVVGRIEPGWRPDVVGVHTLNAASGITCMDVRTQ